MFNIFSKNRGLERSAPSLRRKRIVRVIGGAALLTWAFAVGASLDWIWTYSATPGEAGKAPQTWPAALAKPASGGPALVMFVHPRCPCSRASLAELEQIMERSRGLSAQVLFVKPEGTEAGWEHTRLWKQAEEIPGVTVTTDDGGVLASKFGAETSGHVVMYGQDGRLLFSGGITANRGHVGDNRGLLQVLGLATGRTKDGGTTPVFGCMLGNHLTVSN